MLWAIGLSAVLVLMLWLLTHLTIERATSAALMRAVDVDLAGLADIHASGGEAELVQRIDDRLALVPTEDKAAHYLLATNGGERIAGNLETWPGLDARQSEAGEITLAGGATAWGRATQLGPDLRLVVARESGGDAMLLRQVGLVFLGGGTMLILAVGLIGRFASRRLAARIGRINRAFREPGDEALAALAAPGRKEDEIDELARHSGSALNRLARLVALHRETSDQIAHEVRTPLMHIDNRLVKTLQSNPEESCAVQIAAARSDIRRLVGMLESLLDIASSKARRGDSHGLRPVDLSEIATRLSELYADSAEETGHHFSWSVEPDVIVEGEETQLTRLITNLLDNAFKYVPSGGSISLELARGPVLTVRDDGPGIPEDERSRVFERFYRGSDQRTGAQGSGLGLAVAQAIAERHGLNLTLAETDKGACFVASGEKMR